MGSSHSGNTGAFCFYLPFRLLNINPTTQGAPSNAERAARAQKTKHAFDKLFFYIVRTLFTSIQSRAMGSRLNIIILTLFYSQRSSRATHSHIQLLRPYKARAYGDYERHICAWPSGYGAFRCIRADSTGRHKPIYTARTSADMPLSVSWFPIELFKDRKYYAV